MPPFGPSPLLFFLFARTSPDSDCRTGQYTACLRSHRHQPQPGLQVESNLQQAHLVTFAIPPLPRISLISPLTSLLFYPLSHHIRGSFVFHGHLRLDHIPCLVPVQLSRLLASSSFFTISPPPFAGLPFFLGNIRRVRVRAGRIVA
ncbi:hypothetical protein CBS63078_1172 [Aspergillus niger]|nr:hypothetical protein CBS115989_236 [Aspergillus niger]KAI2833729.1 hypothetical protein CBS133816_70 [Aspergillus niger]KAI2862588.1 hypothetical protein CBS11232_71 [Aspergillus niger]KAI2878202.1 hypothetical protein CBS115988_3273 [Aspergillus niger]KAI2905982.1 hypothetical protein CBS13152_166 [Aspergillus niger]